MDNIFASLTRIFGSGETSLIINGPVVISLLVKNYHELLPEELRETDSVEGSWDNCLNRTDSLKKILKLSSSRGIISISLSNLTKLELV